MFLVQVQSLTSKSLAACQSRPLASADNVASAEEPPPLPKQGNLLSLPFNCALCLLGYQPILKGPLLGFGTACCGWLATAAGEPVLVALTLLLATCPAVLQATTMQSEVAGKYQHPASRQGATTKGPVQLA